MATAESHTNVEDPNLVGRISVFDKTGKFIETHRENGNRAGRVPDAARDRVRFARPADRTLQRLVALASIGSAAASCAAPHLVGGLHPEDRQPGACQQPNLL